jgi:hypothetical protein
MRTPWLLANGWKAAACAGKEIQVNSSDQDRDGAVPLSNDELIEVFVAIAIL